MSSTPPPAEKILITCSSSSNWGLFSVMNFRARAKSYLVAPRKSRFTPPLDIGPRGGAKPGPTRGNDDDDGPPATFDDDGPPVTFESDEKLGGGMAAMTLLSSEHFPSTSLVLSGEHFPLTSRSFWRTLL